MRIRESQVVDSVVAFVELLGFELVREFPLLGKVADIYAIRRDVDLSLAIECKERDWHRSLRQTMAYQVGADLVFLAMPASQITTNVRREMKQRGIGVISVDGDGTTSVVLPARAGDHVNSRVREMAIARFETATRVTR
jgi:hypothetical protein